MSNGLHQFTRQSNLTVRNFPTTVRIRRIVLIGARPYFLEPFSYRQTFYERTYLTRDSYHSSLAVSHQLPSCVKTNSCPFQTERAAPGGSDSGIKADVERLNSSTASIRIRFTLTKILAPSSTGILGSSYALTVVDLPPIYEFLSMIVILTAMPAALANLARW